MEESSKNENLSGNCGFCGALASVKCSSCKSVFYCDRNCQKRHWKEHKSFCKSKKVVSEEVKVLEPLDAFDISNLTLKVKVKQKPDGSLGVFTTDYVKVSLLSFFTILWINGNFLWNKEQLQKFFGLDSNDLCNSTRFLEVNGARLKWGPHFSLLYHLFTSYV